MKYKKLISIFTAGIAAMMAAEAAQADMSRTTARRMMESGKSMSCDFRHQDQYSTQTGTLYFSRGKMRGDFNVEQPGMGTFQSHMIRDDEWQYTWGGPMGNQGMKMRADTFESDPSGQKKGFDPDEEVEMDCREWPANPAVFSPPPHVTFSDTTQMMHQMQEATSNMKAMQCEACEQMPAGPGREQCLRMMGC